MATLNSFSGHSLEYYEQVTIIVPLVVPLAVIPILLGINFVCGCIHNSHPKILREIATMFSFGEEKKHYLYGYTRGLKPPKSILSLLGIKAIVLVMFGLSVLLNESLIADEIGCHSGDWDCFATSNGETIRVTNCSNIGHISDDAIQCYRPGITYSTAISEVGGIAFIVHMLVNAYNVIFFAARFVTNRCLRVTTAVLVILLFCLISFVAPIAFAVGHVRLTAVETLNFKVHNILFAIYYPLIYLLVTAAMIIRTKCTFDDYDKDYDPNTTIITVGGPTTTGENGTEVGGVTTPPRATVQIEQGNKLHIIKVNS